MPPLSTICKSIKRYISIQWTETSKTERTLFAIIIGLFALALPFFPYSQLHILTIMVVVVCAYLAITMLPIAKPFPRISFTLRYCYVFSMALFLCDLFGTIGFYQTPFHVIDPMLKAFDNSLGFHTDHILVFMHAHPTLNHISWKIYNTIVDQFIITLLLIGLLGENKAYNRLIMHLLIAILLTAPLIFFFPSVDPAFSYKGLLATPVQLANVKFFFQIHHFISIKKSIPGGSINFPSFHVIWTLILTYSLKRRKWLFYPSCVYSFFLILTTMTTGWHYLADVLGAIAIFSVCILLTYWLFYRFNIDLNPIPWSNQDEIKKFKALPDALTKFTRIMLDVAPVLIAIYILLLCISVIL